MISECQTVKILRTVSSQEVTVQTVVPNAIELFNEGNDRGDDISLIRWMMKMDDTVVKHNVHSAAAVRSRTMVQTGLLVRFCAVQSTVLTSARTGPENGSRF
jgi:hypothetical protein